MCSLGEHKLGRAIAMCGWPVLISQPASVFLCHFSPFSISRPNRPEQLSVSRTSLPSSSLSLSLSFSRMCAPISAQIQKMAGLRSLEQCNSHYLVSLPLSSALPLFGQIQKICNSPSLWPDPENLHPTLPSLAIGPPTTNHANHPHKPRDFFRISCLPCERRPLVSPADLSVLFSFPFSLTVLALCL